MRLGADGHRVRRPGDYLRRDGCGNGGGMESITHIVTKDVPRYINQAVD